MMSSLQWLRLKIKVQRAAGWLAHLPFGAPLMFGIIHGFRYRIENLAEIRSMYQELVKDRRPLLICCNHLTFMDPVLLHYALSSHLGYVLHHRTFAWNLAASEYSTNPIFGPVCWLSKVLFIHRAARPKYLEDLFRVMSEVLEKGDVVNVFPEGRRSRTGRFDDRKLAFGIGQILSRLPSDFNVLCVYLRANEVSGFGSFPAKGSTFRLLSRKVHFQKLAASKEAAQAVTQEIARNIRELETQFDELTPRGPDSL